MSDHRQDHKVIEFRNPDYPWPDRPRISEVVVPPAQGCSFQQQPGKHASDYERDSTASQGLTEQRRQGALAALILLRNAP